MTVGTGIFLAAIVISLTALFIATKDRWNWKKILLWPLGVCVAGGLAMWGYFEYQKRFPEKPEPTIHNSFWDIPLGATPDDVFFLKGKPAEEKTYGWIYDEYYVVSFSQNQVRQIIYYGDSPIPRIEGFGGGIHIADSTADVLAAFGEPALVSKRNEGAQRNYCYPAYQVLFYLVKDRVTALGIYDRTSPPVECQASVKDDALKK